MDDTQGCQLRKALIEDGYCVAASVLDAEMLQAVRGASVGLLDAQDPEHFEAQKSTGSLICVYDDPFFAELVAWQPAIDVLAAMGYDRPTFSTGFVISKPPHSPPLFWHQDWWGWNHPHSYTPVPQQIFLMYYLVDTAPENGCLRLIPGSHLHRHRMHDVVAVAHTDEIRRVENPSSPAFLDVEGEVDVCVRAGDLVIGDSRLLHSARANQTDCRRTVITLWYHPVFYDLPEPMQAHLGKRDPRPVDVWPEKARELVDALIPRYDGPSEPLEWNREPGPALR
jgi:ectoine hydroxylase-related dioxygenase (phytanoyl-CoA dioxygenase family)